MKLSHIASAIAILATAAIAQPSFAQSNNDTVGLYGGINVGRSRATIDDARIRGNLVNNGFWVNSLADDNRLKSRLYTDIQLRWAPNFLGQEFGLAVGVGLCLGLFLVHGALCYRVPRLHTLQLGDQWHVVCVLADGGPGQ